MRNDNRILENDRSVVNEPKEHQPEKKWPAARPCSHALVKRLAQQGLEQVFGLAQRLALGGSQAFVAFDDLLATLGIKEPVRLVQPGVYYLFADPGLEERSSGQRILMRIGSSYATVIKDKLREIRQELKFHMREKKTGSAG